MSWLNAGSPNGTCAYMSWARPERAGPSARAGTDVGIVSSIFPGYKALEWFVLMVVVSGVCSWNWRCCAGKTTVSHVSFFFLWSSSSLCHSSAAEGERESATVRERARARRGNNMKGGMCYMLDCGGDRLCYVCFITVVV